MCQYCREIGPEDHQYHALWQEVDAEQVNNAHNENMANVGHCLRCGSTDATNGVCERNPYLDSPQDLR